MSEIIDALNRYFKKEKNNGNLIQEELSKTFFPSSKDKKKRPKIKLPKLSWLITAIALILAPLLILFRVHIDISVRPRIRSPEELFFIKGGRLEHYFIKDRAFFGGAHKFSREKDDMLVLVNSGEPGWANFSIELKEPMNMKRRDIAYVARGQVGDEYLVLVLVDRNNTSYRMEKDLSSALTKNWQEYTINLRPVEKTIDMANISIIRFEFGGLTTGNYPSATIFLKDMYTKRARVTGWL